MNEAEKADLERLEMKAPELERAAKQQRKRDPVARVDPRPRGAFVHRAIRSTTALRGRVPARALKITSRSPNLKLL